MRSSSTIISQQKNILQTSFPIFGREFCAKRSLQEACQIITIFGAEQAEAVTESAVKLRTGEIAKLIKANPDDAARDFASDILRWMSGSDVKRFSRFTAHIH